MRLHFSQPATLRLSAAAQARAARSAILRILLGWGLLGLLWALAG